MVSIAFCHSFWPQIIGVLRSVKARLAPLSPTIMSSSSEPVNITVDTLPASRIKRKPTFKSPFVYTPSSDGTDTNLLILLHGLGDTPAGFGRLGASLNLPQTATLAIAGPESIPYLLPDEQGFQWHKSFDDLGEIIEHPDPRPAVKFLKDTILKHLTVDCGWKEDEIHLFGFAQGGSVAGELALALAQETPARRLASIVSVCGPLYSFPTPSTPCGTPVLVFNRIAGDRTRSKVESDVRSWRKGFGRVVHEVVQGGAPVSMLANKDEWGRVMAFWADVLQKRMPDGVYAVRK